MTTTTHPEHGPVSLDRLHQIREILSKAAAQSDGGNLGYAMADAVKVIYVAIAAFGAEPVACPKCNDTGMADSGGVQPWGEPILIECDCRAAMLQGAEPVSNRDEFTMNYLQGHKDGLEWAAQLAEANHPQTGDWLYDDPIEIARVIRKGPDMPPAQTALVVDADDNFYSWFRREWHEHYQHNQYTTAAKQMLGVMAESAWKAGRRAAMLQAGNYTVTPDCWIPVSERMPEEGMPLLICSGNGVVQLTVYGFDGENWIDWYEQYDPVKAEPDDLWQPLPAAPQQEAK